MSSGRFAVATHLLALLARAPEGLASDAMAASVRTNAVIVRRILGALAGAGLVATHEGRGGGYRLVRAADSISLCEVYRVMEPCGSVAPSSQEPNPQCTLGCGMRDTFDEIANAAKTGLESALSRFTVADVVSSATNHSKINQQKQRNQAPARRRARA